MLVGELMVIMAGPRPFSIFISCQGRNFCHYYHQCGGSALRASRPFRPLDCGGTTPLFLHALLASDALELTDAFILPTVQGRAPTRFSLSAAPLLRHAFRICQV